MGLRVDNVEEKDYWNLVSYVWMRDVSDFETLVNKMMYEPYDIWAGCAFASIVITDVGWGYCYTTISGRKLIYIPERKELWALYMDDSEYFRMELEDQLGKKFKEVDDIDILYEVGIDRIPEGGSCFLSDRFYVNTFDSKRAMEKAKAVIKLAEALKKKDKDRILELLKIIEKNEQEAKKVYNVFIAMMLQKLP